MTRLLLLALLMILCVSPAFAEEGEGKAAPKSAEGGEGAPPKDKQGTDVTGGRFAGDPVYVHLAPMILPVITDNGAEQLVTLVIDVQVKDFDVADDIHTNMPRVMDALVRGLYGGLGQGSLRNDHMVDVAKVKTKATAALGDVIGADKITDVLVQAVAQRML